MSSPESRGGEEVPKEQGYKTPGLRGARTTTLFRAINPELFIKPVSLIVQMQELYRLNLELQLFSSLCEMLYVCLVISS